MNNVDTQREPIEALAEQFIARHRAGERPSLDEYITRHPDLAEEIRELFPTIAALEGFKLSTERGSNLKALMSSPRPRRLGDFRIIREIGRGGMGVVFEAEQSSLGRRVAVKVLGSSTILDEKHLLRFRREARTAARLHHTNIVPVFGVGEHDGLHYYAMQYIRGVSLDRVLEQVRVTGADLLRRASEMLQGVPEDSNWQLSDTREWAQTPSSHLSQPGSRAFSRSSSVNREEDLHPDTALPEPSDENHDTSPVLPSMASGSEHWRTVASLGLQAAQALEYAHSQGVLHRDIKPANLLLEEDGTLWVADFGLAKAIQAEDVSKTGDIVGTLRYMAPEQLAGQSDALCDVYSLGITLYELATLHNAFGQSNTSSLIRAVTEGNLQRPSQVAPAIPRDLETIILKSTAREPAQRYASADDLAEDLERFLENRPIRARRASPAEKFWRWCRRNPAVASLSGLSAMLLVLLAVSSSVGYLRATKASQLAQEAYEKEKRAYQNEKAEREKLDDALNTSMAAFERIFQRFVPERVEASGAVTVEGDEGETVSVPAQPSVSPEDAKLLSELLNFYERLGELDSDRPELQAAIAKSNRRVGDIHRQLGDYAKAIDAYMHAAEQYERLRQEQPDQADLRAELARVHNQAGQVHRRTFDSRSANEQFQAALDVIGEMKNAPVELRFEQARAFYFLSLGSGRISQTPGPRPGGPGSGRGPGGGGSSRRPGFSRDDDRDQYRNHAIAILTELLAESPNVPDHRYLLALCHRDRARANRQSTSEAREILEALTAEYPEVPDYRLALVETLTEYDLFRRRGSDGDNTPPEMASFKRRLNKGLTHVELLVREHPNAPDYSARMAEVHYKLALANLREDRDNSREHLGKAVQIVDKLANRFPDVPQFDMWRGQLRSMLAGLLIEADQKDKAQSELTRLAADLEQSVSRHPNFGYLKGSLGHTYRRLADLHRDLGDEPAAVAAEEKASQYPPRGRPDREPPSRTRPPGPPMGPPDSERRSRPESNRPPNPDRELP